VVAAVWYTRMPGVRSPVMFRAITELCFCNSEKSLRHSIASHERMHRKKLRIGVQSRTCSCARIPLAMADPMRTRSAMRSSGARGAMLQIGAGVTAGRGRGELSAERDAIGRAGTCNAQIPPFHIKFIRLSSPHSGSARIRHSLIPAQKGADTPARIFAATGWRGDPSAARIQFLSHRQESGISHPSKSAGKIWHPSKILPVTSRPPQKVPTISTHLRRSTPNLPRRSQNTRHLMVPRNIQSQFASYTVATNRP
jgi:hypothetical protein